MTTFGTRSALLALGLATIAAPALAQTTVYETHRTYVRPGYGFTGALQQTEAQTAAPPPYVVQQQGYTYVQPGYVVTTPAPATTYTYVAPAYPAPATIATAPILDRDTIEDRLDDQGYDDIKVGELHGTFYSVRAEDRDDRKVWLKVDATTGYVLETQPRR